MDIITDLRKAKVGRIITNATMDKYTTYKIGGPVLGLVIPNDYEELINLIEYIKKNNIKHKVIGNGSNIIFTDKFYDGIIIKLDKFNDLKILDNKIVVGAGYNIMKLALKVSNLGYTGLEFAAGIPGTVGGAVYMNAGAYNTDMGYVVSEIKVLTDKLEVKTMYNKDLEFHYRESFLQKNPEFICLEATIILKKGQVLKIKEVLEDRKKRRLMTQPLEFPSAGSVFRNPINDYAGRLVEDIGYKGYQKGGAMVSEKHANFIINVGNASFEDVKTLVNDIQEKVFEKHKIKLKAEQEFVE